MIQNNQFRADLFYRINGLRVTLARLRARHNVSGLIEKLLSVLSPNEPKNIAPEVLKKLLAYQWPGNVRELQQALKLPYILSTPATEISMQHFSPDMQFKLAEASDFTPSTHSPLRLGEEKPFENLWLATTAISQ